MPKPIYCSHKLFLVALLLSILPAIVKAEKFDTIVTNKVKSTPLAVSNSNSSAARTPAKAKDGTPSFHTLEEKSMTIFLLVFSIIVLMIASVLLYKFSSEAHVAFKYFIIVLLVLGMLILIPIGYDHDQLSPAVGLFGTIAGYLLGKSDK